MISVVLFLLLNFILFIPRYVFNSKTANFFPVKEFFPGNKLRVQPLLTRFNEDVFKVNFEYALVFLILAIFKEYIFIENAKLIAGFFYFFTLLYFLYHNSIFSIFKSYPSLKLDYLLVIDGIKIGFKGFRNYFFLGFLSFVILSFVLFLTNFFIVDQLYNDSFWMTICCSIICFLGVFYYLYKKLNPFRFIREHNFEIHHYGTIQSSVFMLNSNQFFSNKAKTELSQIPNLINDSKLNLPHNLLFNSKPNVYIIGVESYGAILYENEIYQEKYTVLINKLNEILSVNDWKSVSILSNAVVTGGTSWVSFGSFLKGLNIKSDFIYRHLINNQEKYKTQSLFSVLEKYGYENYLVSGLGGFENYAIEWNKILSFLGTKNVIKYADLEYKGETFNFGPSAPDQYLLNKSRELIEEKSLGKPFALFLETINSHYNFDSPTLLLDDWKRCAKVSRKDFNPLQNLSEKVSENYFEAISYQLECLVDFILKDKEKDSIYVLFGDHQPPFITNAKNSYKTPIHIISKESLFVKSFEDKGFNKGLLCNNSKKGIDFRHSDFLKIFIKALLK